MIAYLEKYGTTVDVPDDASQSEIKDINDNFPSYVNQSQSQPAQTAQPSQPAQGQSDAATTPTPPPQWQPNLYEGLIKPILTGNVPGAIISAAEQVPGAKALAAGTIEGLSFGAAKPVLASDPAFAQEEKDYPVKAFAGEMLGGLGSLMIAGGAAKALGAGVLGAKLGTAAVKAGAGVGPTIAGISAMGQRFIPIAIMGGATFGTQEFIKHTVQAFQDGNVNLEQFGKDVLKSTAFGTVFGSIGGIPNVAASVASASGLFFTMAKMQGADNREATLQGGIAALFEMVGSAGKSEAIRMEALKNMKDGIAEYVGARNPGSHNPEMDAKVADAFVNHAIQKAGFDNAEDLAKSGPENLLEGIEKVNQAVRTAKIQTPPPATGEPLAKLPAPIEPEAKTGETAQPPKTPLQKAIEDLKGIAGLQPEAAPEPKPIEVKGDTYEEKIQSLKDQGHDVSKMDESAFPEDMKDVYHFEQGKTQGAAMEKGLGEIAERFQVLGIKPNEGAAIFQKYGLDQKDQLGQPTPFYHGSGTPGITRIDPNYTSHEGLFGQGFYVTNNPDVATGYAKSRGQTTGQQYLYKAILKEGKTLDLESPLSDDFKKSILDQATSISRRYGYELPGQSGDASVGRLLEGIKSGSYKTNQDLFKAFREMVSEISNEQEIPTSEFVEDFQELTDKFRRSGYDALTYTGGLRQGQGKYPNHKVAVVINPDMISSLKQLEPNTTAFHPHLIKSPIEYQYKSISKELAKQRGLDPEKPNAQVQDHAQKAVDLINGYFSPKSQEVKAFVEQHPEASDHDIAQMAYNRNILEAPNPDLLKAEVDKAKQENPTIHAMSSSGATMERPVAKEKPTSKAAPEVAAALHEYKDEIKNLLTPYKSAPLAAINLREKLGLTARRRDMAEAAMADAKKMFDKWTPEQIIEFYDRAEEGLPQATPELDAIEEALQKPLRDLQQEINKETGRLSKPIPNYMAHIWKQGDDAIPTAIKNASKRPWQGSKAFLKQRTIDKFSTGIKAGLDPDSWNPAVNQMTKLTEMSKFLVAHQTLNELKKTGLAVYSRAGADHPQDFIQINDGISDVYKSPMIAVKEAFDAEMMDSMNKVAKSLGIDLERNFHTKEGKGQKADTWGLSFSQTPGEPGKIWTKFAGPESALAHELGHQIDNIYGLQEKFLSDPKISKELSKLADERASENPSDKFKDYIQSPPEKMAVMMEAYIHAPDLFKEVAPTAYQKLESFLNSEPKLKPLTEIEPSLRMGVNESQVHAGGAVIAGHYWVQPDAARIINNYLSPGLNKSKIIQAFRMTGNIINQLQLALSAFHMNFTSSEAIATQIGEAIDALAHGDIKEFSKHAGKSFIAPVSTVIRGDEILKAWRGQGKSSIDEMLANILAISGGRAHMDNFYATKMVEQIRNNFKSGKYIQGVLRAPLAAIDAASAPIMEHLVPRMKLGIFAEMMETELRNNPNMTHDQLREVGGKIWDTIDDRMGQIVYDNLFWNKSFKDSVMLTFRSVGWNHGLLRLVAGSASDTASIVNDIAHGRKPTGDKFNRLKYWLGSAIFTFTANAIYQRLKTGKGPSELKDYVYPKNGGVDSEGKPTRSIPFQNYFKDLYHMGTHPLTTAENKLQPMWAIISQALTNKDYFGTKIINQDDPLVNQIGKEAEFIGKAVEPFSVSNMGRNLSQGNKSIESVIGPWVGDIPAPYDIDQTKAQALAHDINAGKWGSSGRTEEQVERSKLIRDLTQQYKMQDPKATENIEKAYDTGLISHAQRNAIYRDANLTPLQHMVKGMSLDEAERVYDKANTEEKAQLELRMEKKRARHEREFVAQ